MGGVLLRLGGGLVLHGELTFAAPIGGGLSAHHRPCANSHQSRAVPFAHEFVEECLGHAAVQAAKIWNGVRADDFGVAFGWAARFRLALFLCFSATVRFGIDDAARGSGLDGGVRRTVGRGLGSGDLVGGIRRTP